MKRAFALVALLYLIGMPMLALGGGVANNPNSPNALTMQGPDPTGNLGYPISTVTAPGTSLDVNIVGGGGGCVTQCTSPWIVGFGGIAQPVSQNGTWTVQQGTPPWSVSQSGVWTVGATQGTSPWVVGFGGVSQPVTVGNFPATQPVSGTVTANQGGAPWSVSQSGTWNVGLSAGANTIGSVNQGTSPWVVGFNGVSQPVTVGNFPATQPVSGTVTANQGGAPWSVSQSGTWTVQQGTPPWTVAGNLTHNNAAPAETNVGGLVGLANAAAPTYTEGKQVLLSTDLAGNLRTTASGTQTVSGTVTVNQGTNPWTVAGNKTDNNAAPGATNVGTLPGLANAAAPTRTEGDQVALSTDLLGYLRTLDNHPTVYVTASFTRPANTTTYTANTYLSNSTSAPTVLTFSGCARTNGGTGRILTIAILDEANQTTKPAIQAFVFDSTSVTAHNDNSAMAESNADLEHLVGMWSVGTVSVPFFVTNAGSGASGNLAGGAGYYGSATGSSQGVPFQCQGGSTSLGMLLELTNAYVPISAEKFVVRMGIIQD